LRQLGWRVDLFAPRPGSPDEPRSVVAKAYEYLRATWQALWSLGTRDAVYVRAHALAWPVAMAARLRGRVLVEEVNGTELDLIVSRPWLRPLRPCCAWLYVCKYRRSQHSFPVATSWRTGCAPQARHDRISVVPNAANTDLFRPMESDPSETFVVFFGGLTDWHGVDVMVDAVRGSRPGRPDSAGGDRDGRATEPGSRTRFVRACPSAGSAIGPMSRSRASSPGRSPA